MLKSYDKNQNDYLTAQFRENIGQIIIKIENNLISMKK